MRGPLRVSGKTMSAASVRITVAGGGNDVYLKKMSTAWVIKLVSTEVGAEIKFISRQACIIDNEELK